MSETTKPQQQPLLSSEQAVELAARCAHEANRAWCMQIGDLTQQPWDDAPEWQRHSARRGVAAVARGESSVQLHESWMRDKLAAGWVFGFEKRPEATHPCLVPYDQLPRDQQLKDALFQGVVRVVLGQFFAQNPDGTFPL